MQSGFAKGRCMQLLKTEGCLGPAGLGSHHFTRSTQKRRTNKQKTNSNKHPSCHYAQTLWMLKKMPLWQKKKKYASYYLKKCVKMLFLFFFL